MTVDYYGPEIPTRELFQQQMIDNPPRVIAIDTETISLKEKLPIGISIAVSPYQAWYFRCLPERDRELELLQPLLTNPAIIKVFANAMFDIRIWQLIFQSFNCDESNIFDIIVAARLCGRTGAALNILVNEIGLSTEDAKTMLIQHNAKTMLGVPQDLLSKKCANDAMVTLAYYHHILPELQQLDLAPGYIDIEWKVMPILIDMSLRGLRIDQERRALLESQMEKDRDFYKSICDEHDFNPGSGQQVGYVLAKRGNFLPFTRSKKQLKTDEETLEFCEDPLATVVLGYKRANSILTKYLYPLRDTDYLYTEYGLDTEVGRTKSSNFNMQNIPAKDSRVGIDVRQIFVPDTGVFTNGDFSQLHLRFLAHMSQDREMRAVYEDGKDGGDIHTSTMNKTHKPRAIAKIVNYAIPYGGDPHTLAKQLKTKDLRNCASLIDEWFAAYPEAAEWIHAARDYALRHNKSLPTLFGRQIAIPDEFNRWGELDRDAVARKGANYPILGSDGEIMKRALIICNNHRLPLSVQVHDSISCLAPETLILKADLKWIPLSAIQIGDLLVGIDENKRGKGHRHLRLSTVENKINKITSAFVVVLDNDEIVVCSADHRWLVLNLARIHTGQETTPKTGWVRTDELKSGVELKCIGKPWIAVNDWNSGYIAGLLDGEGSLGKKGKAINFTQNDGLVLENYVRILESLGFTPHIYEHGKRNAKQVNISLLQDNLRLLGVTRPVRLLDKANDFWQKRVPQFSKVTVKTVIKVADSATLIDLQTSTKTFFANGLVSHNCDGDIEFPIAELESISEVKTPFNIEKTERWK